VNGQLPQAEQASEILVSFGCDADDARAAVALDPAALDIEIEQRVPHRRGTDKIAAQAIRETCSSGVSRW